jgi:hypothetical protein
MVLLAASAGSNSPNSNGDGTGLGARAPAWVFSRGFAFLGAVFFAAADLSDPLPFAGVALDDGVDFDLPRLLINTSDHNTC